MSYQRPPRNPQFNRDRANGIWKKIRALAGDIDTTEVVDALAARGIEISNSRVSAWSRSETSDKFSPMSIEEIEVVLDALVDQQRNGVAD